MATILDGTNFKRSIAEIEACVNNFPGIDTVPPMFFSDRLDCFKKLRTMQQTLAKAEKIFKGFDSHTTAWDKEKTLKLSGFKRGFHPKRSNIKGFFQRSNITVVDHAIILADEEDQEEDYIIVLFESPQDADRALSAQLALCADESLSPMDLKCPATCAKGVYLFDAVLTRMSD